MKHKLISLISSLSFAASLSAASYTADFDSLSHGEIVNTQYAGLGLNISASNAAKAFDRAVIFDSNATSNINGDTDLLFESLWAGGNAQSTDLGNLLIIQERDGTTNGGTFAALPDDEAARPAGYLSFRFDYVIRSFGFHFVDIETPETSSLEFFNGGSSLGSKFFSDFSVTFGDRYANEIDPLDLTTYGSVDEVRVNLGGSGAIGDLNWSVPDSASTLALLGLSLTALGILHRRRF